VQQGHWFYVRMPFGLGCSYVFSISLFAKFDLWCFLSHTELKAKKRQTRESTDYSDAIDTLLYGMIILGLD
jgi:hypothetical protein